MAENALKAEPLLFDDLPVDDLGTISIRVFVLPPKDKKGQEKQQALPLDAEEGEEFLLETAGSTPVSSYLESSRGKRCVVYLVNGQRQEYDDNTFIVQELGFRYLRSRMMIMIDVDGLAQEAIGRLMQGSRQGFYRGAVREAITKRIVATLKTDPDLIRLEQEAEEAVSELSAGDEKVKQTLDQLIDSHHDKGHAFVEGIGVAGDQQGGDELGFKKIVKGDVVTLLPPDVGQAADYPVLTSQPAASIIRLRPNVPREIAIKSIPSGHWAAISQFTVEGDSKVLELNVKHERLEDQGKLTLTFNAGDRCRPEFLTERRRLRAPLIMSSAVSARVRRKSSMVARLLRPSRAHCALRKTTHRPNASIRGVPSLMAAVIDCSIALRKRQREGWSRCL